MTNLPPPGNYPPPPPPGGGYPPPPPPGGGYPPPPPSSGGFAPPPPVTRGPSSPKEYTPWATRVLAWLIDWLPVVILSSIGALLLFLLRDVEIVCTDDYCPSIDNGPSGLAWTIYGVLELVSLAYVIWNLGRRQGTTGSSIGKGILKFEVVSERTGQPIGFGRSLVREIAYAVAYVVCFLPWVVVVLFPLWDAKRQTLVDKLVKTVCRPR